MSNQKVSKKLRTAEQRSEQSCPLRGNFWSAAPGFSFRKQIEKAPGTLRVGGRFGWPWSGRSFSQLFPQSPAAI